MDFSKLKVEKMLNTLPFQMYYLKNYATVTQEKHFTYQNARCQGHLLTAKEPESQW